MRVELVTVTSSGCVYTLDERSCGDGKEWLGRTTCSLHLLRSQIFFDLLDHASAGVVTVDCAGPPAPLAPSARAVRASCAAAAIQRFRLM